METLNKKISMAEINLAKNDLNDFLIEISELREKRDQLREELKQVDEKIDKFNHKIYHKFFMIGRDQN